MRQRAVIRYSLGFKQQVIRQLESGLDIAVFDGTDLRSVQVPNRFSNAKA